MAPTILYKLFFLLLLSMPLQLFPQTSWHLTKSRNGIKVYTADNPGSDFKLIKATLSTQGQLEKVIRVFRDVKRQPEWVYSTKNARILNKISENELIYYVESSLPWPLADRYVVARMKIEGTSESSVLTVSTVAEPGQKLSVKGKVRVSHFIGKWEFKQLQGNRLSIYYYLDIDPAGSVPASVVNMFVTKGPYNTLMRLSALLR